MPDIMPEGGAAPSGHPDTDQGESEQRKAWQPGPQRSGENRFDDSDVPEEERGRGPRDVPGDVPVFSLESAARYTSRWTAIRAGFVDDPHRAVEDADRFVAEVVQAFASGVESRRQTLTSAWEQDGHGQTEELRRTMQQYRVLVDQLLR